MSQLALLKFLSKSFDIKARLLIVIRDLLGGLKLAGFMIGERTKRSWRLSVAILEWVKHASMQFGKRGRLILPIWLFLNIPAIRSSAELSRTNFPPFVAIATVSMERFNPFSTNAILETGGKVLFSYTSNGLWQMEFASEVSRHSGIPIPGTTGTLVNCRRIPDGTRYITIFPSNQAPVSASGSNTMPFATAESIPFPPSEKIELFLPWLSLCPEPELPLIDAKKMKRVFTGKLMNRPENEGDYSLLYSLPDDVFLSKLDITNNGIQFQSDGSIVPRPKPYDQGYREFEYSLLESTNINGLSFPSSAILRLFAPTPSGKSRDETYPVVVARLKVLQIDIGNQNNTFTNVPSQLLVLDSRPAGLQDGVTVNYIITNDQWTGVTNRRMQQLATFFKHQRKAPGSGNSGTRLVALGILIFFIVAPPVAILIRRRLNNKTK